MVLLELILPPTILEPPIFDWFIEPLAVAVEGLVL